MTALPPSTDYTGVVTQGQKKAFMTNLRGYLSGLFGDTGDKPYVDEISEKTPGAGVTADGVLMKDGLIGATYGGTGFNANLSAAEFGRLLQVNYAGNKFELAGPMAGFKNKLINGDFRIWQRGTSFATYNIYTADRWHLGTAAAPTSASASRQAFTLGQTTVPGEPEYYYRFGAVHTISSNIYAYQRVENVRTLAGQKALITFWAKASQATNLSLALTQYFGSGGSANVSTSPSSGGACALTTAWQKFTRPFTLPSIAGKTIGAGNSLDVVLQNAPGSAITVDIDLADVQLLLGDADSPFERRPEGIELALCRRYFRSSYASAVAPGTAAATANAVLFHADKTNSNQLTVAVEHEGMRATPATSLYNPNSGASGSLRNYTTSADISSSINVSGADRSYMAVNTAGVNAGDQCRFHYTLDAEL